MLLIALGNVRLWVGGWRGFVWCSGWGTVKGQVGEDSLHAPCLLTGRGRPPHTRSGVPLRVLQEADAKKQVPRWNET